MEEGPLNKNRSRFERSEQATTRPVVTEGEVPFVEREIPDRPFADVESRGGVDQPEVMLEGWTTGFEAAIGRYVTSPAGLLAILADRRRAVAVVSCRGVDFRGNSGEWVGTGFIVGKNLFVTNNHVINSREVARDAVAEFGYEVTTESLLEAGAPRAGQTQKFKLDPSRLFVTSPAVDGLDYTFVWIEAAAQEAFGFIKMERGSFTAEEGMQTFIIHHPEGEPKAVSLDDTEVFGITTRIIHYSSDTKEGSSGAPVFDPRGRLIALHHASRRQEVTLHDGGKSDTINEGIKIAAIAIDLQNRMRAGGSDATDAEAVLKEIGGSDTMTGFFGALGRDVSSENHEAVVETYIGTDQDIDLGFWNVEIISAAAPEPEQVEGAAQVIADLNFDVWGFPSIVASALDQVIKRTAEKYGEQYSYAVVDRDAPGGSAGLLWKTSVMECTAVKWPSKVEPLFRKSYDLPGGRQMDRIFETYPGLFRLQTSQGMPDYMCHVVLCRMDAPANEGVRRSLASRILGRALDDLARETGSDVILCGNPGLVIPPEDLAWISGAGYSLLNALNEKEGRILVIQREGSGIDDIFLSPGMKLADGSPAGALVTKDLDLSSFVKGISERSPIAMRLSLAKRQQALGTPEELDALIERLLASSTDDTRGRPA